MNRGAERPVALFLVPHDRVAPHRQARHGEGGEKSDHRGANEIVVDIAGGEKRRRRADRHL